MKARSSKAIQADLVAIGLDNELANKAAGAAGLSGQKAEDFADENSDRLALTSAQQRAILPLVAPRYERYVNQYVRISLRQYEFDALVCFVYNPSLSFVPIANAVNRDDLEAAATLMRQRVYSGTARMPGLIRRRERETALLLYGQY